MDVWQEWLTGIPAGIVGSTVGVGAFVAAILTGRLMTLGQHVRRVGDLVASHTRELAEKDARLADLRESREAYKEAARVERERADLATEAVRDVPQTLENVNHVLQSLDAALPKPRKAGAP